MNYPTPENNPHCLCSGNPARAFWCETGHKILNMRGWEGIAAVMEDAGFVMVAEIDGIRHYADAADLEGKVVIKLGPQTVFDGEQTAC